MYGTQTNLIERYSDRYINGLIESTELWHENEYFLDYLIYGDSDMYIFAQSFKTKTYSIHNKESFDDIIYETQSDKDFFEKIVRSAIDEDFDIE